VKLYRADPDALARDIARLYELIERAADGRNAMWRLRQLIAIIQNAERYVAANADRFELLSHREAKAAEPETV
jgi:hypothetical protein